MMAEVLANDNAGAMGAAGATGAATTGTTGFAPSSGPADGATTGCRATLWMPLVMEHEKMESPGRDEPLVVQRRR